MLLPCSFTNSAAPVLFLQAALTATAPPQVNKRQEEFEMNEYAASLPC